MLKKIRQVIKKSITNWRAPYIGTVLMLIPFYFYSVENYYESFYDLYLGFLSSNLLVSLGVFPAMIGFFIIIKYFEYKTNASNKVKIESHIGFVLITVFLILSWGVSEMYAHMNVVLFVWVAYMLLLYLKDIIITVYSFYAKLDKIEKITLIIPVLTLLLDRLIN